VLQIQVVQHVALNIQCQRMEVVSIKMLQKQTRQEQMDQTVVQIHHHNSLFKINMQEQEEI